MLIAYLYRSITATTDDFGVVGGEENVIDKGCMAFELGKKLAIADIM